MARKMLASDWRGYLGAWDRQQEEFNPWRERRFQVMFDVLETQVTRRFTALDLGCGPGSLTARMLKRFPLARSVAVDFDPVVLRVGRGALGTMGGRITWVDARIPHEGWRSALPAGRFDAALSTTALHWLRREELRTLYHDLRGLLRPGGVFLDGDILPWDSGQHRLRRIADKVYRAQRKEARGNPGWAGWKRWWERAEAEPALRAEFRERKARGSRHPRHEPPSLGFHVAALRRAGFHDVDIVWQELENRILMAIR